LPWLAAVVAVALGGALGRRACGSNAWGAATALAIAAATPLLLYATLHWEHSLAVALLLGALLCLAEENPSRTRQLLAGVLVGIGPAIRTELYCAPLAVAAFALALWGFSLRTLGRLAMMAGAALFVSGAFWTWNLLTLGTWDPILTVNRHVDPQRAWTESFQ